MSFKFAIPIRDVDLQTPDKNSYCVTRVFAPTEIPGLLKSKLNVLYSGVSLLIHESIFVGAKSDLRQNGPIYIIDHFDTFYSVLRADDCPIGTSLRAFDALYESVDKMARELKVELNKSLISESVRLDLANVTKMLIYLLVNTIKVIDTTINNSANDGGKVNRKVFISYSFVVISIYTFSCSFVHSKTWTAKHMIGRGSVKMV